MTLILRRFQRKDQEAVRQLILSGLGEHWGHIDATLNPDLDCISTHYADAIFLVGEQAGKIVGTGALVPRTVDEAEVVRMSVSPEMRRFSIGTQILKRLCNEGKQAGFSRIILETTATWRGVIEFYKQFGFQITHHHDGEFGREVYFSLDIGQIQAYS